VDGLGEGGALCVVELLVQAPFVGLHHLERILHVRHDLGHVAHGGVLLCSARVALSEPEATKSTDTTRRDETT